MADGPSILNWTNMEWINCLLDQLFFHLDKEVTFVDSSVWAVGKHRQGLSRLRGLAS